MWPPSSVDKITDVGKMTETFDYLLIRISIKGNDFREVKEEKQKKYCCYEMVTNLRVKCKIITINIDDNENINY